MALNCIYSYKHNYCGVAAAAPAARGSAQAGFIFMRTEKAVKIIITANILIKQEEVVKH